MYNYFIIFRDDKDYKMLNFIKKYLLLLKQDFWLFAILSIPGMVFYFTGLLQLDAADWFTLTVGAFNKFAFEFCTVSILFCLLHVLGLKKRWAFALVFFFYYVTITADIVLLIYFKERFGAKYLPTLAGGQYKFLLDIRMILMLAALYGWPYFAIRKFWLHRRSRHASAKIIAAAAVFMLVLGIISPTALRGGANSFYAAQLLPTTAAQIALDFTARKYPYQEYEILPPDLQTAADEYGLFAPDGFKNNTNYDRIILLTTEALSGKFIKSFNPAIPAAASGVLDRLVHTRPFASLKPSALSTLYGLSVIFSGHPNAELMYKNGFPLSFVKILRDNGWRTVFIRGADEEYMNEHLIFKSAGFDEIYGAGFFERDPRYSGSVAWWGLTDRKLFEYAADYLKRHKDEKLFINILTVDTHVPSGRDDYPGQLYPPVEGEDISAKTAKIYERVNMARAFANFDYDLGLFLNTLWDEGLLDERTLLIITADHPFFANVDTGSLFKNYRPVFDEVPFILVGAKSPDEAVSRDLFKSQQDIAPTVLGLAGLPAPRGMFGRSIFEETPRTAFYIKNGYVIASDAKGTKLVPFSSKKTQDMALLRLLNSVVK
ncbi:MAG: sulfatase-like hydrolase/transferase [Elusimicrobiota bacterium]|nr:sulfatase-like hydrolase/transferase [Elusimicrobiota bacterium]